MTNGTFLQPVFQERLWGGTNLTQFGYDIPNNSTGECWAISAHKTVLTQFSTENIRKSLKQVWDEDKALFGNDSRKDFPLLTKILDAHDCLSVQVHPDDEYALKHEGEYGKTECWYILDAQPGAEIIYGVNATSKMNLNI